MPDPTLPNSRFVAKLLSNAWWIALLGALLLLWIATERRIDRVERISGFPTWSVEPAKQDSSSPTGFEANQRSLIVPGHHNPSYAWIMEAQQSVEEGSLRLRRISYDSAPDGREIRRTSPYRWWLITVGWVHGMVSGEPIGAAIEWGTIYADPLLLAGMLVLGAFYCRRSIGSFASLGFVLGGVSIFPLTGNFQPGAPDPHSLAWVLAMGSVLPLFASIQKSGTARRFHFVIAGLFCGLGFWNDAESQAPVLLAIALGAGIYECARARNTEDDGDARSGWRAWGLAGSGVVLAASLFEFAPSDLSWSLDSINPIHSVIVYGIAEILHTAVVFRREGSGSFGTKSLLLLGAAVLAAASWPVVGVVSESGGLLASDFYAREMANHANGGIAQSLGSWLGRAAGGTKFAVLLPSMLLLVLVVKLCMGAGGRVARGRLVSLLIASLVIVVLAFFQIRWWNLFDVFALVIVSVLFAEAEEGGVGERLKSLCYSLFLLPGLFVGFPPSVQEVKAGELTQTDMQSLVERDFSYWLNKRVEADEKVLFSTPMFSGAVAYYGGFDVVVSSDDGNRVGFDTAVRIASAGTEQEASILLNSRNISHVVIPLWDSMFEQLVRIGSKVPAGQALPPNAFGVALHDWAVPMWMRPLNYPSSPDPKFGNFGLMAFSMQAEQEPELALSRLADLFVERGQLWEAESIREALKAYPRSLYALAAIANINFALKDAAKLEESLEAVIPYLSRRAARNLPLDRRVNLATLLYQNKRVDLARDQMAAGMEELDLASLRTLTPNAVTALLALSRSLDIPFPSSELKAAALDLVPTGIRERLTKG